MELIQGCGKSKSIRTIRQHKNEKLKPKNVQTSELCSNSLLMENIRRFIDDMDSGMSDIEDLTSQLACFAASGEVVFEEGHVGKCSICGDDDSFILWARDTHFHVYDGDHCLDYNYDGCPFPGYIEHDISFCSRCCGR